MKQLLLMRHAKSSWDHTGLEDIERPLNERGLKDAPEMGKRIHKRKFEPDLILSSNAKRAIETAFQVSKQLHYPESKLERETGVYDATIEDMIHIIRNIDEKHQRVMIVGHNPTFTGLVGYLGDQFIENLPTSGIVLLELNIQLWKQTIKSCGKLTWFDFPKNTTA